MKPSSFPFFLAVAGTAGILSFTFSHRERSPADETESLTRDVRIIPGPVAETSMGPPHTSMPVTRQPRFPREACLDCHFTEKSPILVHPGTQIVRHNPETFGCTTCHGGDGRAKNKNKAHAPTGSSPFLKGKFVEISCGRCHQEPAVPEALYISGGRFALDRYGCITCHDLPVARSAERYASSLDFTGTKLTQEWLSAWLDDPYAYNPGSRMPKVEMKAEERNAIVGFLMTLRTEIPKPVTERGNAKEGASLYADYACESCHVLRGEGNSLGPALDKVNKKLSRAWTVSYLRDPATLHPGSIMPSYDLTDQQAADLTEFLFGETTGVGPSVQGRADKKAEPGFDAYVTKGCAQCHSIQKYVKPNITETFVRADYESIARKIREHPVPGGPERGLGIPESDIELMAMAVAATQRSGIQKKMSYDLGTGSYGVIDRFLGHFWRTPVPLQSAVPSFYNRTVAHLGSESCGTCHGKQLAEWSTTRHSKAMGPGIVGQMIGENAAFAEGCYQCHAPLSEQAKYLFSPSGEYEKNRAYDEKLSAHGVVCSACHVRGNQRFGPPFSDFSTSASVFGEGHHGGAVISRAFEDSRFCSSCHQFQEGDFALNGKLLQDTYNEWLASPQAEEGETCQSCHMPDRKHTFKGIHDRETVLKAVKLGVEQREVKDEVEVQIRLTNEGAGHYLPTYVTPAIFVTVRLLDANKKPISGTEEVRVIQRRVSLAPGDTREIFDTRIPPKGAWEYQYRKSRPSEAKTLEVKIDVHPDYFYNGFFKEFQAANSEAKEMIRKAFDETERSPYQLMIQTIPLP